MIDHPLPGVCDRIVLDTETIRRRVSELGESLVRAHGGRQLSLVTVLKGGLFFLTDLSRSMECHVTMDFMAVTQYAPGQGGVVRVVKDLDGDIEGEHVVLVEDVVDTGLTVNYIRSLLLARRPASLEVCTLLDKPGRRIADVPIDYRGFELGDEYIVGYGLDLKGRFRNLPYVASVRPEVVYP